MTTQTIEVPVDLPDPAEKVNWNTLVALLLNLAGIESDSPDEREYADFQALPGELAEFVALGGDLFELAGEVVKHSRHTIDPLPAGAKVAWQWILATELRRRAAEAEVEEETPAGLLRELGLHYALLEALETLSSMAFEYRSARNTQLIRSFAARLAARTMPEIAADGAPAAQNAQLQFHLGIQRGRTMAALVLAEVLADFPTYRGDSLLGEWSTSLLDLI